MPIPYTRGTHVPAPEAKTAGAAGVDLAIVQDLTIHPGEVRKAPTGIRVAIPSGCVGLLALRSSCIMKGVTNPNGIGVIDSDYRGEIMVPLRVTGSESVTLREGDRIAQLVVVPIEPPVYTRVHTLDDTERGEGGFGSTGE